MSHTERTTDKLNPEKEEENVLYRAVNFNPYPLKRCVYWKEIGEMVEKKKKEKSIKF